MKLVDLYAEIARMHRDGVTGVVATVVAVGGSTPRSAGAKMIVYADGRTLGTVGGGAIESDVIERARAMADSRDPVLLSFDLGPDLSMACGGRMDVFLEPVSAGARVVVIGGGHCGQAVAAVARQAGFRVTVVDDRADMVSAERFPGADRRLIGGTEVLGRPRDRRRVLRRHRDAGAPLRQGLGRGRASPSPPVRRDDRERGEGPRDVRGHRARRRAGRGARDVHAPIGLDIGAETPDEIAVSVVAEMVAVKHGIRDTAMLRDKPGKKGQNR